MSRRRSRASGRRAKKGASRVILSPLTLLFAAVLLAYVVSTRSFADLPKAYKFAVTHIETPTNSSLGDFDNVTNLQGLEMDEEELKTISERARSRHERSQERRKGRIANIHHRLLHKHQDEQEGSQRRQGKGNEPPPSSTNETATPKTASDTDSMSPLVVPPVKTAQEITPSGARTSGKMPEFRGALGGTKDGMLRGQNITRVSYTVYKIMKLFGFSSLTDSPAGAHAEWMPEMVRRMTYDVPFFQYVGVDTDEEKLSIARKSLGETVDGEFYVVDAEEKLPNATDVLFHWTELDGSERDARSRQYVRHVARVMKTAKERQCGYIVLGQFPRLNGPSPAYKNGRWTFLGAEEEEPFLFNEHVRGVVPTASGAKAYMLYLTFYSLKSIPGATLEALV